MATRYKLVYTRASEVSSRGGAVHLLVSPRDGSSFTLSDDEFELARLFDGQHSVEEVMDRYFKRRGTRISRAHLHRFVESLTEAGLLHEAEKPSPVRSLPDLSELSADRWGVFPGGSLRRSFAENDHGGPLDADYEEAVPIEPEAADLDPPLEGEVIGFPSNRAAGRPGSGEPVRDRVTLHADDDREAAGTPGPEDAPEFEPGWYRAQERDAQAALQSLGPRILLRIPVRWLLPLGWLLNVPLRSRLLVCAVVGLALLGFYGIWVNRAEFFRDLALIFGPLTLAQTLLISMVTVNLAMQLARAAALRRATGHPPPFGIIMALRILPRFYADLSEVVRARDPMAIRNVFAASLNATILVFVGGAFTWFMSKNTATSIPLISVAVTTIAATLSLLVLNPLARRDGYQLLTHMLKVPDLREQALGSLLGRSRSRPRPGSRRVPTSALRIYGLLLVAWMVTVGVSLVMVLGWWLEAHWGGLGVLCFMVLFALALSDPVLKGSSRSTALTVPSSTQLHSAKVLRRHRRQPRVRPIFLWGLVIAVTGYLGSRPYTYEPGGEFVILPAKRIEVRALMAGDIRAIFVKEGNYVERGQLVGQLADDLERKNTRMTESKLDELHANLAIAEQGATAEEIALAVQRVKTAETRHGFSRDRAERLAELIAKKVISQQEYEDALAQAEVDEQHLLEERKALELLQSGSRPEQIEAIEANIATEEVQLEFYQQQLEYTQLRAGISGRIVSGTLQFAVGDYLDKGDQLAIIEATETVQAEIKVPEADIGEVSLGSPVRLKTWALPDREFAGTVQSIAPTAEPDAYGKVVRILTVIDNEQGLLKSELTGHAKIRGDSRPAVLAFTRLLWRFLRVELWSWLP